MRRQDQVVLARMSRDIAHGDRRQVPGKLSPLPAAIDRNKQPELGSNKKQIAIDAVLANHMRVALDRVRCERIPRLSEIGGLEDVNLHVAGLMVIERDVSSSAIEAARLDAGAPRIPGQARDVPNDVCPRFAAVARDLKIPI